MFKKKKLSCCSGLSRTTTSPSGMAGTRGRVMRTQAGTQSAFCWPRSLSPGCALQPSQAPGGSWGRGVGRHYTGPLHWRLPAGWRALGPARAWAGRCPVPPRCGQHWGQALRAGSGQCGEKQAWRAALWARWSGCLLGRWGLGKKCSCFGALWAQATAGGWGHPAAPEMGPSPAQPMQFPQGTVTLPPRAQSLFHQGDASWPGQDAGFRGLSALGSISL